MKTSTGRRNSHPRITSLEEVVEKLAVVARAEVEVAAGC
jgi:hypothetical protein